MTDPNKKYELVSKMLRASGIWNADVEKYLGQSSFTAIDDGGMGSFRISHPNGGIATKDCAETDYRDDDGVPVVIALLLDDNNNPVEVDFWKVNSQPLVRFPEPESLFIRVKA